MKPLLFVDLSLLSTISNLSIYGYHTNSAGQSTCFLDRSGSPMTRVQRTHRYTCPLVMETSLSNLKNPFWSLHFLVYHKLIRGEQLTLKTNWSKDHVQSFKAECLSKGLSSSDIALKNPHFKAWRSALKRQIKMIQEDRSDFKKTSEYVEGVRVVKDALSIANHKNRLGLELLRHITDQALDEYTILIVLNT